MPWKNGLQTLTPGKAWTDSQGRKHGGLWHRYSAETMVRYGIVWEDPPARDAAYDKEFYWGRDVDGNLIERSLTDTNITDDDGNAVLDDDGNQAVDKGLKTQAIERVKEQANEKLAATDWMIIKSVEDDTFTVPQAILDYRAAVRSKSNSIETSITNAADHAAFRGLYDTPVDDNGDPTGNAPIQDWPDEI
jgi:hypothetical protein